MLGDQSSLRPDAHLPGQPTLVPRGGAASLASLPGPLSPCWLLWLHRAPPPAPYPTSPPVLTRMGGLGMAFSQARAPSGLVCSRPLPCPAGPLPCWLQADALPLWTRGLRGGCQGLGQAWTPPGHWAGAQGPGDCGRLVSRGQGPCLPLEVPSETPRQCGQTGMAWRRVRPGPLTWQSSSVISAL